MVSVIELRARIRELERYNMKNAPEPVRARNEFDLKVLKELLRLEERLEQWLEHLTR
jgi:hypothetical protein